jgi:hypothetical protein
MKSDAGGKGAAPEERSWDLIDRCLLPLLFSHAAAILLSTILFHVSTFPLFVLFLSISLAATLFYHNLKVGHTPPFSSDNNLKLNSMLGA